MAYERERVLLAYESSATFIIMITTCMVFVIIMEGK